CMQVLQTPFTC
nr:immunoglobulin light chain junction region [Macaca mulatta]MPN93481.1 immunoglobulin light chain junction region [Macaca mulatta]MPN93754.1 immunoglobulin light chain junction region [Macaca mulatta]MPN94291.1 immunoglobulin light chain junction region [Macaca mulatta]MPN95347.1 immunoglobulin light chain junction region [Macaca mulatta]